MLLKLAIRRKTKTIQVIHQDASITRKASGSGASCELFLGNHACLPQANFLPRPGFGVRLMSCNLPEDLWPTLCLRGLYTKYDHRVTRPILEDRLNAYAAACIAFNNSENCVEFFEDE